MKNKLYIIIPAFNESKTIGKLISKLQDVGYKNIIIVDDGSSDNTYQIAKDAGAIVLKHVINRGVGGAWRTGFEYVLQNNAKIILIMDADLQHKVENIPNLVKPILDKKADIVIGTRRMDTKKMPLTRKIGNRLGNFSTRIFYNQPISDSQSGFRCLTGDALRKMKLYSNRMEICSEMVGEIKRNNLRLVEVPITTVYTKYSLSKGQGLKTGIKTLIRLISLRFK